MNPHVNLQLSVVAKLPTTFGDFRVVAFADGARDIDHVALVCGDVDGGAGVLTRVHSECLTGDALGSLRCDCRPQLESALRRVATEGRGVVCYLRQEGRGIGLVNKLRAYALQEQGLDTIDANRALGFEADERDYGVAVGMIRALGIASIRLLTNNPDKVAQLQAEGLEIVEQLPHTTLPTAENVKYLLTKQERLGHKMGIGTPGAPPGGASVAPPREARWAQDGERRAGSDRPVKSDRHDH